MTAAIVGPAVILTFMVHWLQAYPRTLQDAVLQDDRLAAWMILRSGHPVDETIKLGQTPLFHAQSAAMVRLLVERGADVNAKTPLNLTPLFVAIRHNRVDVVRQMLDFGADVEVEFGAGGLPIHFAAYEGEPKIVAMLIEHGTPLQVRDGYGMTPLVIAERLENHEAAALIRQALLPSPGPRS